LVDFARFVEHARCDTREMAIATLPNLFQTLDIGPITIPNRIVSAGHDTILPTDGTVNDALIAYQEARARGGTGLIIVQVAGIHESARYTSHNLMATDDGCIPGYRRLAQSCHAHGTRVFGQLFHPGREIMESQDGHAPVALAPSAVPNERFHVTPRALTLALITELVDGYAAGAARLAAAGLDGVEIVASHGYLPAQFLNPRVNQRTDAFGGDEERRLRFIREVIEAVRARVGTTIAVGMRISGDEKAFAGLEHDEVIRACAALDQDGGLDYIHVVAGSSATLGGSVHIVPPMTVGPAYTAPLAAAVKAVVSIPVIVAGRINQPQDADRLIGEGVADACAMTRALICDPAMPGKAAAGAFDEIRACIGCNQACIGHFHAGYPISCIQHPETGREGRYGARIPATTPRRIMVVGGGPGGLKAAAVAAERGHDVTLLEASTRLGGQANYAARLPQRAEFGGIVTNLEGEARRAGVRIETGARVDAARIASDRPDAVIVATGARPRIPELELHDPPPILDAWAVLDGAAVPTGHVVVADWRCDWIGPGLAERLATDGRRVTLAVNGYHPGQLIQQYVRDTTIARLHRLHVQVIPLARLYGAQGRDVYLQHTTSDEPIVIEDVDAIVLALGHRAEDGLLAVLEELGVETHPIGDCLAPRTCEEAVLEGLEAGCAV
jgi:2,4-dienoyl-CoA reductase-like NADH-dependent reductase (Old Yellow Enzyme family)